MKYEYEGFQAIDKPYGMVVFDPSGQEIAEFSQHLSTDDFAFFVTGYRIGYSRASEKMTPHLTPSDSTR